MILQVEELEGRGSEGPEKIRLTQGGHSERSNTNSLGFPLSGYVVGHTEDVLGNDCINVSPISPGGAGDQGAKTEAHR